MLDTDTFVTTVYVIVDDFCKEHLEVPRRPGPASGLSASEIVTLGIVGQMGRFSSEADFYRFAGQRLRAAFPALPSHSRYNRALRMHQATITRVSMYLAQMLRCAEDCHEAIDCTAVPVRNHRRRGNSWLLGEADYGRSTRRGWFYGFRLLIAVSTRGVITGFCLGSARQNDRALAEALFALRQTPSPRVLSTGTPISGTYLADAGFAGKKWLPRWAQQYGAWVIAQGQKQRWSKAMRRWLAHHRQIVETVFEKLEHRFGLERERPHELSGLQTRLAAKVALHNICIWINRALGRPDLATADLLRWD